MSKRVFLAGAAGGLAAAVVFFAIRQEPDPDPARRDTEMPRAGKSSTAELPSQADPGRATRSTAEETGTAAAAVPKRTVEGDTPPRSLELATPEELDSILQDEARDGDWAPAMELGLGQYLASQPQPNALGSPSVECRATLCRIQTVVDHATYQAAQQADLQGAMHNIHYDLMGRELVPLTNQMMVNAEQPGLIVQSAYLKRAASDRESRP